ncbi:hypothetical protein Gohar_006662 [Gossypium harknessii]|uniref:Uncharacterized protein n=1 Tax=Gossypium harknessii TaxID=34285 RepID=A0A7J9GEC2_9ROSI|nr:hypothetical protein [Gossypium harknessii]
MDVIRRHRYHILHPIGSVAQARHVGRKGAVDSIRDGGNARVGMRKNDDDWREMHKNYIEAWDRRMKFLSICEPFFSVNTMAYLKYLSWFKVISKSYLLSRRARRNRMTSSSSALPEEGIDVPRILHPDANINAKPNVGLEANACTFTDDDTDTNVEVSVDARDTRWEAWTASHSSTEEGDGNEGEDEDEYKDKQDDDSRDRNEQKGEDEGDDDEEDGNEEVYRTASLVVSRNPPHKPHPPPCSTHSPPRHD